MTKLMKYIKIIFLNRCLIEKREQKPTLTYIWSNKNDLTLEEQDVYNQLKDKKMRYPNRSIIVKVNQQYLIFLGNLYAP